MVPANGRAMAHRLLPRSRHAEGKGKQFIIDQTFLRRRKRRVILGEMNIPERVFQCTKPAAGTDLIRKRVCPVPDERKRGLDVLCHLMLGQSLGERVKRNKRRKRLSLDIRLADGGRHGIPLPFHTPEKAEGRADCKTFAQIILVVIGDLAGPAFIKGAELEQRHAAADHGAARFGGDRQNDGRLALFPCLGQKADVAAVFVSAREMSDQIAESPDPQFFICRRLDLSDAMKNADRLSFKIHLYHAPF